MGSFLGTGLQEVGAGGAEGNEVEGSLDQVELGCWSCLSKTACKARLKELEVRKCTVSERVLMGMKKAV